LKSAAYFIVSIFLLSGLLYVDDNYSFQDPGPPAPWPHQGDTPPERADDSAQWMCVTDGTLQISGWCTTATVELE